MPRTAEAPTSDSENERLHTGSTKKKYSVKKPRQESSDGDDASEVAKQVESTEGGPDEEGEGEEEYEIEAIIDAKKGQFPGGRMGYFVKWKGYEEEHNSWVDEQDAGNAQDLIDAFWAIRKKSKPAPRKSEPIRTKPKAVAEKPSRKSLANMSSPDAEVPAKKRGRPRKDERESDAVDVLEGDEEEQRAKKKPRRSNGAGRQSKKHESDDEVDDLGNMRGHMKVTSWENLVHTIDTVERQKDGELYVFFTLKNEKKRMRENSRLCAQKFPQKLIEFYESNLRWKTEDESPDTE
ncbi:hypothetical protein PAXRUDRAFT_825023 [Paxillus rubicundulus Ve08.2h10]|uniref:Chromo domain-containing protein n=1 Tax=Paxillus rubicundulus Ve08.2h10 TaxID=930991 RepID=A0A0D0DTP0_9AGAM|nr:hypothetical protein PAXRUDRAFT_825023 [Paxillus rubicundulus Ve08.2h10]